MEQKEFEKSSIYSPLTLTQMKLSRGMINRFTTRNGAIINDLIHIFKPSFKIKLHDQLTCYIPYSFLLEQYHKRIAQLFTDTLRKEEEEEEGDTKSKVYDVTNQHIYEWLKLIGQQIVASETLSIIKFEERHDNSSTHSI